MFSKELEMLIEAAIADGEITEKERELLHKRAKSENVDIDELDMIIDAKLAKIKKKQAKAQLVDREDSTLVKLQKALQEVQEKEYEDIKRSFWENGESKSADRQRHEETVKVIRSFYIPTDKREIMELLTFLKPYAEKKSSLYDSYEEEDIYKAYKDRYKETCEKAKAFFSGDTEIEAIINPKKKGLFSRLFGKK